MRSELHHRVKKAGQPPGTLLYTGTEKTLTPQLTVTCYSTDNFHQATSTKLADCFSKKTEAGLTWLHMEGLNNEKLLAQVAKRYQLHPLTVEDILNVTQRAKIEEFDNYVFITMKMFSWNALSQSLAIGQFSLVLGENFILSFIEHKTSLFNDIKQRLSASANQPLREQGCDYLAYRLIDTLVDQYFVALEGIGEQIETLEERIIADPTPKNSRTLYKLKHKILGVRKAIWPMREVVSHLLQTDRRFVKPFTQIYLRDVYDHIAQAIDTVETFRDMLASILDIYLSSLSNRMNEIMKVLTIISTIFIPTTFVASIYGMNFKYMPELDWHWGYPCALAVMLLITIGMLIYFRRKKWL
jgi:magnesium transporter